MLQLWKEELRVYRRHDVEGMTLADRVFRASGFYAIRLHRVAHFCALQGWRSLARAVVAVNHRCTGIRIHASARIGKRVYLEKGVVIDENAHIPDDARIFVPSATRSEDLDQPKSSDRPVVSKFDHVEPQSDMKEEPNWQARLRKTQQAIKELARVTKEQNRVIAKLNDRIVALGGEPITDLPTLHTQNMGLQVSLRRARRKTRRKTNTDASV